MLAEREQFFAALTTLLDQAIDGHGRVVFLGSEAGAGKTALTGTFAQSVDLPVRHGGCDNLATAAALGPFIEAFPELHDTLAADRVDRLGLLQELRGLLSQQPALVLLEDLHWADEASLDLLRTLARRVDDLPALVIATFRSDAAERDPALTGLLGDLATNPGVARMELPPLTLDGVRLLVARAASPIDAEELHRITDGNPFFVTEVLADGHHEVPSTVRDAVLARMQRLSPAGQQVLRAAAVVAWRSSLAQLAAISAQPAEAVDECVRHGMLVADGDAIRFGHELARRAVAQTLPPGEIAAVHRAALDVLQHAPHRDDRRLAYHAAGCEDAAAVRRHASPAAADAARLGAHREAAELYRLALQFTDDDDPARGELYSALSYECYLIDQLDAAHAARLEAMRLAERRGDQLEIGTAQRWLSRLSWFLGRNAESEQWATRAVATLEPHGPTSALAMAYSNMAQLRMLAGDGATAVRWGERAIALARQIGDVEVEAHALNNVGSAEAQSLDDARGFRRLAQSLDLSRAADLHEHAARAFTNIASISVANRRFAEAEAHLQSGIAYCRERDLDSWTLYMRSWLAVVRAEQGQFDAAVAIADEVLRHRQLSPITRITASVVSARIAQRRDQPATAQLDQALALAEGTGESQRLVPVAVARAEAAWLAGHGERIVAEIDRAWPAVTAHPNPWQFGELAWWLTVAGDARPIPPPLPEPFALMRTGDWAGAAQVWRALGCPLWVALTLARSPDLEHAREALAILDELGASAVRAAVLRDRHLHGLALPRGPRGSSQANPWGLTAREIEILELLVAGLSNAELARQLYLSQKTVGHHVSAILRKLDVPTRSRAIAAAVQHGIVGPS